MASVEGITDKTNDLSIKDETYEETTKGPEETDEVNEIKDTTDYPTNGLKIHRVKEEDINIMKVNDNYYKIKLFNMKSNIFMWDWDDEENTDGKKQKHTKRIILKQHSLYRRISDVSVNLRKTGFGMSLKDFRQTNNKKAIAEVINDCIDFIEKTSEFEEIPIDTLLKDTE